MEFDVALLAFHGLGGEDGQMQGLFETLNLPYTGMRTVASAVFMDKVATKKLLRGLDIPLLPYAVVSRTAGGLPSAAALEATLADIGFPCIVKPVHLGSSIGVGKADNLAEARVLRR
jgi:D-alanine-D-alanine ligase